MNTMFETFKSMDMMLQIYWILAAVSSIIFIIQGIMTFAGFDADSDADIALSPDEVPDGGDAAFDADGFHLVSIKSIICFILGFGWTGALCWGSIPNHALLGFVAFLVGLVFMFSIAFLMFQVMKLNKDNTFHVKQVVGKVADVYLRIPAMHTESGKIQVSMNGSMHELEAYTDACNAIPTGAKVKITEVIEGSTVLVAPLID